MTYQRLHDFMNTAGGWIKENPADSKLHYALKKVMGRVKPILEDYAEQVEDLNIKYAATTADDVIKRDANGRVEFKKADALTVNKEVRQLFRSEAPVVSPHLVPAPKELTYAQREAFADLVIAPEPEQEPT